MAEQKYSALDKGRIYTTGALFLDVLVGQAFTGRPFHESLGVELPDYLNKIETFALAAGSIYLMVKPYHESQKRSKEYCSCP